MEQKVELKWFDRAESAIVQILLLGLLGTSIVSGILDWPTEWLIPVLLLALLLTVRMLTQLTDSNQEFDTKLDALIKKADLAVVTTYDTADDFYRALAFHVGLAKDHLQLTYLRSVPPITSPATQAYFAAVERWVESHQEKSARRVICLRKTPDELAMREWIGTQQRLAEAHSNFELRFLDWPMVTDGISMAILDHQIVFLLFAGFAEHRLHGMSVSSAPVAQYLDEYFDSLWTNSTAAHVDINE